MNAKKACKNCGASQGLHHYETNQCPRGGVEADIDDVQIWANTTYLEDDGLLERIVELEAQVARLLEAVPQAGEVKS